jgi:NDP-sugar pyrophosphorylase family protein
VKVGIIAAGTGERLARGGVHPPKPLVPLRGEPMIARLIRAAGRLKAESVACIVNDLDFSVSRYLRSRSWPLPLELVVRTTPNSMESLLALAPLLKGSPFLLSTVDAVFPFDALETLLEAGRTMAGAGGGVLALTTNLDDEKPLWTSIDAHHRIIAMGENAAGSTPYATAGFYYFDPAIFSLAQMARARKLDALRRFLALLLESGYPLYGLPVSRTIDVDYPEDIAKAEDYLVDIGENS